MVINIGTAWCLNLKITNIEEMLIYEIEFATLGKKFVLSV